MKARLIKWDAAQLEPIPLTFWQRWANVLGGLRGRTPYPQQHRIPDVNDPDFDPSKSPACVEVVEMDENKPRVTYRR